MQGPEKELAGDEEVLLFGDSGHERNIEEYVARSSVRSSETLSSLSAFQRAADRYPPLTGEQQLHLASVYREGRRAAAELREKKLSPRKRAACEKSVAQGEDAMQHLCASCWRLAWLIVREQAEARFGRDRAVTVLDDLMAEANTALVQAVTQFDPDKTSQFYTYAGQMIRNHIRGVLSRDGYMRLAPSWNRVKRMAVALIPELTAALGRHPSIPEIQDALMLRCLDWAEDHLTEEQKLLPEAEKHALRLNKLKKQGMLGAIRDIEEVLVASQSVTSLDRPLSDEESSTVGSVIADTASEDMFAGVELKEARAAIMAALATLTDREREIILLRFGFADGETWTYLKIAERYEVTAERIRQVERAALAKLGTPHGSFASLAGFLPGDR